MMAIQEGTNKLASYAALYCWLSGRSNLSCILDRQIQDRIVIVR